ncbi:glycosyltransferase family A protein [Lichenihabitans sp. Uapishka_5]|uniref:glycosyltransferase family 2 protein n=1 Tax=Lichenihabitans sp. Uapishka_5 TaxID=3037302 RepID=UPI0029E7CED7|nr:glycosyltransferase family A protein [Lichenihabitans sp. Uapishka_5]MDX7952284.1 glycosyltransferase family A protein [Lichenihabitans sp. Uapishka_5]
MSQAAAPTIVAIIPLYNGARFIEQSVRSVLDQTRPPDECLVVDDGSTDAGPALVADLATRLPVRLLQKSNGGQSSARNHGVAQSTSSLIAFLDQDDAWYPDHLETLLAPFAARPGDATLGWSYADLDEGDETGTLLTRQFLRTRPTAHPKRTVEACLRDDMFVLPSASLISRTAYEAVGGFDERLIGYEDDDFFIRLLDGGFDNVFIDRPVTLWRIYPHSTSYSPHMGRSRMIYLRKVLQAYGARPAGAGGTLARTAIAPRFVKALLGEYARAGRRHDDAGMEAALDAMRDLLLPHMAGLAGLALRLMIGALRMHGFGRIATQGRFGIARRLLRMPVDHRAALLQQQADEPRG